MHLTLRELKKATEQVDDNHADAPSFSTSCFQDIFGPMIKGFNLITENCSLSQILQPETLRLRP